MGKAVPPADGEDDGRPLSRAQEARLDAALAEYRDRTFAQWAAPDGFSPDSPLGDRRISAAIRAARPPALPRRRLRYSLTAAAAVVGVLAVTAALSTVRDAPGEPETGVLLAAATPGGDRGPFADGAALSRCLDTASVPALQRTLLGAGLVHVRGDRATVLLLPGGRLGDLRLLAVTPACARGEASSVLVDRVLTGDAAGRAATP